MRVQAQPSAGSFGKSEQEQHTHAHCQGLVLLQRVPPPGFSRGLPGPPWCQAPCKALSVRSVLHPLGCRCGEGGSELRENERLARVCTASDKAGICLWACVLDSSLKVGPGRGDPGSPHLTGLPGREEVNESILWIRPDPNLGTSRVSPPIKGTGPHLVGSGVQCVLGALGHFEPPRSLIPAPSCCPSHLST